MRLSPRIALAYAAVVFGILVPPGLFAPQYVASSLGLSATSVTGDNELRAVYGGLVGGLALFFALASFRPAWHAPGLAAQSCAVPAGLSSGEKIRPGWGGFEVRVSTGSVGYRRCCEQFSMRPGGERPAKQSGDRAPAGTRQDRPGGAIAAGRGWNGGAHPQNRRAPWEPFAS